MHTICNANVIPEKSFLKMYDTGRWPPRGVPKCKICCVGDIFMHSHFPHLHTLSVLSPLSSPISHLSHFTPPFLFPKEVNKKLSYRGQNALSVIKYRQRTLHVAFSSYIFALKMLQNRWQQRLRPRPRPAGELLVRPSSHGGKGKEELEDRRPVNVREVGCVEQKQTID